MISTHRFNLKYQLTGPLETAYAGLSNFENFADFHPYMKKINCSESTAEFKEYWIEEELLLFGFIPNRPSYSARVSEMIPGKHVRYTSQVKKNLHLSIDFVVSGNGSGKVLVEEQIVLQANRLVAHLFFRILRKAHSKVFQTMQVAMRRDIQDLAV